MPQLEALVQDWAWDLEVEWGSVLGEQELASAVPELELEGRVFE